MNTAAILDFFFHNNAVLIEVLVIMILVVAAFLTYRSFKASKDEELGITASGDPANMEEMLKKLIDRANELPSPGVLAQSVAAAGPGNEAQAAGAEATSLLSQITSLKKEIEAKQNEIEIMKKAAPAGAAASPGGVANEEKTKLENQVKDLQRKLEEFDIISADIADLSFYKEENLRLQKELGLLKGGTVTATPPPSAAVPATDFKSVAVGVPAPEAAPAPAPVPVQTAAPVAPSGAVQEVVDEDLIKEYAAMVDAQRATSASGSPAKAPTPVLGNTPPAKATAAKAPAPKPAPPAPKSTIDPISGKEVSVASVPGMPDIDIPALGEARKAKPAEPEVDLGTLDLDKMAAEALDLKEPTAAPAAEEILNQAIDPDKLANEASKMEVESDPETKDVMGQFEDFAKREK